MQDGVYRPASEIPIKALINTLNFDVTHSPAECSLG